MEFDRREIKRNRWFYLIEFAIDIAVILFAYWAGFRLHRVELFWGEVPSEVWESLFYICLIAAIIFTVFKPYKCGITPYFETLINLLVAIFFIALVAVFLDYAIKGVGIYRRTVFYALLVQTPIFIVIKYIMIKLHAFFVKPNDSIIIADSLEEAGELALDLIDSQSNMIKIKYLASQNTDNFESYLVKAQQVFFSPSCTNEVKTRLIEYCAANNIDCAVVPSFKEIIVNSGQLNNANDTLLLNMNIKHDIESRFIKRTMDIVISGVGLIVLLPLLLVTALLIRIQDGGKAIYSQERLTKRNKKFSIYKFRTMIENAEEGTGAVLASADDKRITKLGKFLRMTRIDEIPQLLNVLKGDMSLVGPRPERPDLVSEIIKDTPEFSYRTIVKAGLTGLAQIKGRYNTDFRNKLLFDLYYVNNFSLLLDLKIMFNTILVIFTPSASEGYSKTDETESCFNRIKKRGYEVEHTDGCVILNKD